MAMRQWDGGPKAVKADGGGGFLGGAIAGLTGGIATLSLEEFKEEQQRETARIQREALKLMKDEEYNRGRQDKATDRDEERKYQGLLRAEERGYEAADAEAKREHELAMQELRNAGSESSGSRLTQSDRNTLVDEGLGAVGDVLGYDSTLMEDEGVTSELKRQNPEAMKLYEQYKRDLLRITDRDEAITRFERFTAELEALGGGGAPASSDDDWAARQAELRQQYGAVGAGQ